MRTDRGPAEAGHYELRRAKVLRHEFLSPAPRHGPPEGGHYVLMVRRKPDTTNFAGLKSCATRSSDLRHATVRLKADTTY